MSRTGAGVGTVVPSRNAATHRGHEHRRSWPAPSWPWAIVLVCAGSLRAVCAADAENEPTRAEELAFRDAVARVAGAVVRLEPIGGSAAALGAGVEAVPGAGPTSGLVIDPAGWIVTTAFGVPPDMRNVVVVRPDGSRRAARAVGRDAARGLVLLRTDPLPDAPVLEVAARRDLAPGHWALGIGRGWTHATPNVSVGIISAVDRAWGRGVQTDAATSPANYGGALVDIRGRVIGVVAPLPADTAGMPAGTELYDAGIGFAVPLEDILAVRSRLEAGETLEPGILGIAYRSRDRINGEPVIGSCRRGAPAAEAGLRVGDRIVAVDGRGVERIADVRHGLGRRFAGDRVPVTVERGGGRHSVEVVLAATLPPWRRAVLGVLPLATEGRGVTVGWVLPESPAAAAGLEPGDVIETATVADDADGSKRVDLEDARTLAGLLAGIEPGVRLGLGRRRGDDLSVVECGSAAAPADPPADVPIAGDIDPAGGFTGTTTVVPLGGAEVESPALAVIPTAERPRGVLVYFGVPHGRAAEAEAEPWRAAAGRHGVAIVIPGSLEPDRWGRGDMAAVERAIAALQARTAIDPSRVAVAGRGVGGGFAWLAAERIATSVRGVAIWDAGLPRQATIRPAEPGAGPWVLLGQGRGDLARQIDDDRRRLEAAGITVGTLPVAGDAPPAELLCSWVALLGLL